MFIFLMALYFIANTAAKLLVRVFSKKTQLDPHAANLATRLPGYLFGVAYGLQQQSQPLLEGVTPPLLALTAFTAMLSVVAGKISIIAIKNLDIASYTLLQMLSVPVSVVISSLLLSEGLTFAQTLAMTCILVGVSIVGAGGRLPRTKHIGKYESYALLNSLFSGSFIVLGRYLIEQTSLSTMLVLFAGMEIIAVLLVASKSTLKKPSMSDIRLSLGIGASFAIGMIAFWLAADSIDNIALVSSLASFRVVTIFAASYVLLKEKSNLKQKLVGSALATAGLLLS